MNDSPRRNVRLRVAYDGSEFVGWQRQGRGVSIQGLIETALAGIEGAPVTLEGAGRTDAGVHALGQVAHVRLTLTLPAPVLGRALNALLPRSIRILSIEDVPESFHARYSARAKTYAYRVFNGPIDSPFDGRYAWHLTGPLDVDAMARGAAAFVGSHDFAGFQASGGAIKVTIRTLSASTIVAVPASDEPSWAGAGFGVHNSVPGVLIVYRVTGNGFLRHMVRNIVGTLVEVGRGRRAVESLAGLLGSKDRRLAGPTAPAHGLFLVGVDYGGGA